MLFDLRRHSWVYQCFIAFVLLASLPMPAVASMSASCSEQVSTPTHSMHSTTLADDFEQPLTANRCDLNNSADAASDCCTTAGCQCVTWVAVPAIPTLPLSSAIQPSLELVYTSPRARTEQLYRPPQAIGQL
ncbi:hypothetical protein [Reinekea sp. G2M2-21]|uniref:hypothetical protein n=1 Tax=Reinekea sp. G2M2-21 TaxID=2788942 RepID=UPI0018AA18C1|nr:hypothetical protein [Reinekea sp. G2M2-21]